MRRIAQSTYQIPLSTAPMPSKHISPSATTSNPLFNCPHAPKTHFTQYHHLETPFQLPPCPQYTWPSYKRHHRRHDYAIYQFPGVILDGYDHRRFMAKLQTTVKLRL